MTEKIIVKEVITGVFEDEKTGIPVLEDVRGDFHIVTMCNSTALKYNERKYLQSIVKGGWPNITSFHRIPDFFNPGEFLDYIVPEGKIYHVGFILAAQTGSSFSTVGLFIENELKTIVPLREKLFYALYDPIQISAGTNISIRFMPSGRGIDLGINIGGHLIDIVEEE